MKKCFAVSGIAVIILLVLLLTGWGRADDTIKAALRRGNTDYASDKFVSALDNYESALTLYPDNEALNFNAAQTAYKLGEYEKAVRYYAGAEESADKYLNQGNIYYWAGNACEDNNEKMQFYAQALQLYEEGIMIYPQNVPLKYNYEYLMKQIESLLEEQEQEQGEEQEQEQGEEQEQGQGHEQEQGQDSNSEESDQNESDDGEQGEEQNEDGEQGEEEESEENTSAIDNIGENDENDSEQGEEINAGNVEETENSEPDQDAIARILQMLEIQEEQSLKNNQEIVGGNEGKYGW